MKKLILTMVVLWPLATSWAQLAAPNEMGVTFGQVRVIARDVEAEKKIWIGLQGVPIKIDGIDVIKFPGMFVFITQGVPAYSQSPGTGVVRISKNAGGRYNNWAVAPAGANNEGNVINHVILSHKVGSGVLEKLQGQGYRVINNMASDNEPDDGDVFSTENMRIDNNQDDKQTLPVIANAIQFDMPRYSRREALAWYAEVFGAKPGRGNAVTVPGLVRGLAFGMNTGSPVAPRPSRGYTLDRIGFEVVNLEAFCKKLESMGIIFEYSYSKTRHKSFASAGITDPWGVGIELTEGLNKF